MHSSRMRTARSLTVSVYLIVSHARPPGAAMHAPLQKGGGACVVALGGVKGLCMVAWGVCAWLLRGACVVAPGGGTCMVALGVCVVARGGHAWLLWGACMVAPGGHAWDMMRYGDTVNERAVRILLECILVFK